MSQQRRASAPDGGSPRQAMGDPWQGFGYVVAGVLVYGVIGWLLDRWWGTTFMVVIGILVGAGLGIYMTFGRFGRIPAAPQANETGRTEE